ncbi:hypothetical protein EVAR_98253_1 [Eumeta japonica]|uniref:Uncharacterized protein n=1 Tax=Eumeta variegata TaxID=151549 RepID=A0A4C1XYT9_EUMVA|nr:hypothetical protein EVAR_98253_1 [Eumeta japonica]
MVTTVYGHSQHQCVGDLSGEKRSYSRGEKVEGAELNPGDGIHEESLEFFEYYGRTYMMTVTDGEVTEEILKATTLFQ